MGRWRITTEQNGHYSVSSVLLGDGEWQEHLEGEADVHRACGWQVAEVRTDDDQLVAFAARAGRTVRVISARESDPFNDEI